MLLSWHSSQACLHPIDPVQDSWGWHLSTPAGGTPKHLTLEGAGIRAPVGPIQHLPFWEHGRTGHGPILPLRRGTGCSQPGGFMAYGEAGPVCHVCSHSGTEGNPCAKSLFLCQRHSRALWLWAQPLLKPFLQSSGPAVPPAAERLDHESRHGAGGSETLYPHSVEPAWGMVWVQQGACSGVLG